LQLEGFKGDVLNLVFTHDSRRLLTHNNGKRGASNPGVAEKSSGELKIWEMPSGREQLELQGHQGEVWAFAASPDGRRLASADRKSLIFWDGGPGADSRVHPPADENSPERWAKWTRIDVPWHEQQAFRHEQAARWYAAVTHLDQLDNAAPWDTSAHERACFALSQWGKNDMAALCYASLILRNPAGPFWPIVGREARDNGERAASKGDWPRAVAYFTLAIHQDWATINDHENLFLARVAAKHDPGRRETTRTLVQHIEKSQEALEVFRLSLSLMTAPLEDEEVEKLLRLAERFVKVYRAPFTLYLLGAIRYRAGRYEESLETLEESRKAAKGDKEHDYIDGWMFTAMALGKLGRDAEACEWLSRIEKWFSRATYRDWKEQARYECLRQETRETIMRMQPAKD
jgi:tetratricopeptide (TPR) repeat protein